jgi:hypothetical protein
MNGIKIIFLIYFSFLLLAFVENKNTIAFGYPKNKNAVFTMNAGKFKTFKQEWRGEDYYYLSENEEDSIICSVLFYKLNKNEQLLLVEDPRQIFNFPESSPAYPLTYFSNYSNLKEFESDNRKWGDANGDFMFSESDIKEMQGTMVNQKNMNAYTMFGTDLFVNIHLSKINYTKKDSIAMREVLDGLVKKK